MVKRPEPGRKVLLLDKLQRYVDLNTDLGQSGDEAFFEDPEHHLLHYVSSVNIPCCVHDGDPLRIRKALIQAKTNNCVVGAHIAYPDPANLGYEPMKIAMDELASWIYVQFGALSALAKAEGVELEHVRPHGALYTAFLNDAETARTVAQTLYNINPWLILVVPVGPVGAAIQQQVGIRVAPEVYLGKRYNAQGAMQTDPGPAPMPLQAALDQTRQLLTEGVLTTLEGQPVPVTVSTLHISPRMPQALELAEKIYTAIGQPVALPVSAVGASGWV